VEFCYAQQKPVGLVLVSVLLWAIFEGCRLVLVYATSCLFEEEIVSKWVSLSFVNAQKAG
jgi:hypothetical protein